VEPFAIVLTVAAGVVMGAINNLAGGAGIVGLMAFEHACGLPLAVANPSLRPAGLCVGLFALLGYLRAGKRASLQTWLASLWAVPGAPLGSWLAMRLPDWLFWLYLCTVLGLLLHQQTRPPAPANAPERRWPPWAGPLGCFFAGVHMGYAQVGAGLLSTLLLTASFGRDLVNLAVAKSTLVIVTCVASVVSFSSADAMAIGPALWLALGTAIGSYAASGWAVAKGADAMRRVIVGVTAVMLLYAAVKAVLAVAAAV
jgi:uncharacterized membrane protein YfcA